jgi:hypothetical protein
MSCPVCFGGEDAVVRESLNAGIGVLLGVTAVVLGCFARFVVQLVRRARQSPDAITDVKWDSAWGRVSQGK